MNIKTQIKNKKNAIKEIDYKINSLISLNNEKHLITIGQLKSDKQNHINKLVNLVKHYNSYKES